MSTIEEEVLPTISQSFDPISYWENRHQQFTNDHRNVGDRSLTSEQNYALIATKASIVNHTMGRLGIDRGAEVLDAGCGAGVFTALMASAGFKMHGIDVSPTAIAAARERVNARFQVGPLSQRAFDQRFNAVLCLDVMFHVVDDAEWRASAETLFDAVEPGGLLVFIEYFPEPGTKSADHCRWRTLADYRAILSDAQWVETFKFKYPYRKETKTLFAVRKRQRRSFMRHWRFAPALP